MPLEKSGIVRSTEFSRASASSFTGVPSLRRKRRLFGLGLGLGVDPRRPDRLLFVHLSDLVFAVAELTQHLVGVLAQEGRALDLGRKGRKLHRAADGPVRAARLVRNLDDGPDALQERVVLDFLHGQHRRAWHLELAKVVDGLVLGLVREELLDIREDLEDVGLSRLGRGVLRVLRPFRMPYSLGGSHPVRTLDREVDVGVGVGLPAFALEYPARLATAARVATPRDRAAERAVGALRGLLQVAHALEPLLVAA